MQVASSLWMSGADSSAIFIKWCPGHGDTVPLGSVTVLDLASNCWKRSTGTHHFFVCQRVYCSADDLLALETNTGANMNGMVPDFNAR